MVPSFDRQSIQLVLATHKIPTFTKSVCTFVITVACLSSITYIIHLYVYFLFLFDVYKHIASRLYIFLYVSSNTSNLQRN